MTGQASATSVYISIDGGAFAGSGNGPNEIGRGVYSLTLTSSEASFTSYLIYQPVCNGAQTNTWVEQASSGGGGATAQQVWEYSTRTLTASPTDISGLATSSALSSVASNVLAVKAKTDNLPASPAAVGSAMTLTSAYDAAKTASQFDASSDAVTVGSTSISAIQSGLATSTGLSSLESHGDSYWATATGFATASDLSGLSTFDPTNDTVTINSTQAATMVTATGFATPSDLAGLSTFDASNDTVTIDSTQAATMVTATGFATPSDVPSASDNAAAVWGASTRTLTSGGSGGATAQEVWEYTNRTLTSGGGSGGATAQEVWEYSGNRTLTASPTDISGLATASALSGVASDVSAVKAKTDNLPSSPAATSDIPTAATISGAVWSATTRTITGIPSTVADLLNQIHARLGDWTMGTTTLVTPEGNYTLTRDEDGNITKITPASTQGGT